MHTGTLLRVEIMPLSALTLTILYPRIFNALGTRGKIWAQLAFIAGT